MPVLPGLGGGTGGASTGGRSGDPALGTGGAPVTNGSGGAAIPGDGGPGLQADTGEPAGGNDAAPDLVPTADLGPPPASDAMDASNVPSPDTRDADSPDAVSPAVAQCQEYVATVCMAWASCQPSDEVPIDVGYCRRRNEVRLGCVRSTESLTTCLTRLRMMTCDDFLPPGSGPQVPGICDTVTAKIPRSTEQTKCDALVSELCAQRIRCAVPGETALACASRLKATDLPCNWATAIGASYDTCVGGLRTQPCPVTAGQAPPPLASCRDVVTFVR